MHANSVLLFDRYAKPLFGSGQRVLEIGPDRVPSTFEQAVSDKSIRWDTLDIAGRPGVTYLASDGERFPIPTGSYDIVFSTQVIEHVRRVWIWVKELARVCRSGGYVITIGPVSWPYHEAPIDCWRIYPEGMRALYEEAGLAVMLSECVTLEVEATERARIVPYTSAQQGPVGVLRRFVKRVIGFPVFCAYDTVTIGIKVQPEGQSEHIA